MALNGNLGIECDLRKSDEGLIISHDPVEYSEDIDIKNYIDIFNSGFVALNIKESGLLEDFKAVIPHFNGFVFDFELCGATDEIESWSNAGYKIAKRYSDRGEYPSGDFDYIWVDEMDESGSLLLSVIDPDISIYVSPELHGRPISEARVNMPWFAVCTDNPQWWLDNFVSKQDL